MNCLLFFLNKKIKFHNIIKPAAYGLPTSRLQRKKNGKRGPPAFYRFHGNGALVLCNDVSGDEQAEPGAFDLLGGKKQVKDL
jgi:hypothetical protein